MIVWVGGMWKILERRALVRGGGGMDGRGESGWVGCYVCIMRVEVRIDD